MTQQRLISLDMLRGLAMAGMILVNNPGSWSHIYVPLEHSVWNGLTPTDLVFPFFVFAMGMAMGFSTKGLTASRASYLRKVMKRSVLLFVIGLLLTLIGRWLNTGELCFSQLRVMGVLQRLSLSYLVVAFIVRRVKSVPTMTFVVVALLSGYWLLLMLGHGFDFSANNIVAIVDRWLLGESHLYIEHLPDGTPIAFDPEGLLSTIPCVAQVLLGYICSRLLYTSQELPRRILRLAVIGALLLLFGLLLSYMCPLNKKIWSPTFVMVTSGYALLAWTVMAWFADLKKQRRWAYPLVAFGSNALALYVFSGLTLKLLGLVKIGTLPLPEAFYNLLAGLLPDKCMASAVFGLLYVGCCFVVAHVLYKRELFIKL